MGKFIEVIAGTKFGWWKVIKEADSTYNTSGTKIRRMLCECECSAISIVALGSLKNGHSKSCGCSIVSKAKKKTGKRFNSIYRAMISRCKYPTHDSYRNYGGRGIKVCDKWNTFEGFVDDMFASYIPGLTIDRIDNEGDYCKDNCRWSTTLEQNRNKRDTIKITHLGETKCLSEWARIFKVDRKTLENRMKLSGLTFKEAIEAKNMKFRENKRKRG